MAALLNVKIITPKEVAYDGLALAVTIPAEQGEMQVYQGHVPVLARLICGVIRIETLEKLAFCFDADEGFVRVTQDDVSILVDTLTPLKTADA